MGPLQGLKVIEMAGLGPTPFCAMLLADMGADVVRVERANAPADGVPIATRFKVLGRGRRSAALDLKTADGIATLRALITRADILLEGYRPGTMERLGLGPDDCKALNQQLVYGRMTGWGQTGPLAQAAGHDLNYIAITGVLDAIGTPASGPVPPLNLIGNFAGGGMMLAMGLLAAHIEAKKSGTGQVVDAAMADGASLLMTGTYGFKAAGLWNGGRGENILDGGAPWYAVYETSDTRHATIACIEPRFYEEFLRLAGIDATHLPGQHDRARWPELRAIIAAKFLTRTLAEWTVLLADSDACFAPVLRMDEAASHPHMAARGNFITLDGVVQPAPAPRFSRTPSEVRGGPSEPGADTDSVLKDWGISDPPKRVPQASE